MLLGERNAVRSSALNFPPIALHTREATLIGRLDLAGPSNAEKAIKPTGARVLQGIECIRHSVTRQ